MTNLGGALRAVTRRQTTVQDRAGKSTGARSRPRVRATRHPRALTRAHPDSLAEFDFAAGSMGPKVEAAIDFARSTGHDAFIGSLADLPALLAGAAGTRVCVSTEGITYR